MHWRRCTLRELISLSRLAVTINKISLCDKCGNCIEFINQCHLKQDNMISRADKGIDTERILTLLCYAKLSLATKFLSFLVPLWTSYSS